MKVQREFVLKYFLTKIYPENDVETTDNSRDSIQLRWFVKYSQNIEKYADSKCIYSLIDKNLVWNLTWYIIHSTQNDSSASTQIIVSKVSIWNNNWCEIRVKNRQTQIFWLYTYLSRHYITPTLHSIPKHSHITFFHIFLPRHLSRSSVNVNSRPSTGVKWEHEQLYTGVYNKDNEASVPPAAVNVVSLTTHVLYTPFSFHPAFYFSYKKCNDFPMNRIRVSYWR